MPRNHTASSIASKSWDLPVYAGCLAPFPGHFSTKVHEIRYFRKRANGFEVESDDGSILFIPLSSVTAFDILFPHTQPEALLFSFTQLLHECALVGFPKDSMHLIPAGVVVVMARPNVILRRIASLFRSQIRWPVLPAVRSAVFSPCCQTHLSFSRTSRGCFTPNLDVISLRTNLPAFTYRCAATLAARVVPAPANPADAYPPLLPPPRAVLLPSHAPRYLPHHPESLFDAPPPPRPDLPTGLPDVTLARRPPSFLTSGFYAVVQHRASRGAAMVDVKADVSPVGKLILLDDDDSGEGGDRMNRRANGKHRASGARTHRNVAKSSKDDDSPTTAVYEGLEPRPRGARFAAASSDSADAGGGAAASSNDEDAFMRFRFPYGRWAWACRTPAGTGEAGSAGSGPCANGTDSPLLELPYGPSVLFSPSSCRLIGRRGSGGGRSNTDLQQEGRYTAPSPRRELRSHTIPLRSHPFSPIAEGVSGRSTESQMKEREIDV